jgi:hypothetical protein
MTDPAKVWSRGPGAALQFRIGAQQSLPADVPAFRQHAAEARRYAASSGRRIREGDDRFSAAHGIEN